MTSHHDDPTSRKHPETEYYPPESFDAPKIDAKQKNGKYAEEVLKHVTENFTKGLSELFEKKKSSQLKPHKTLNMPRKHPHHQPITKVFDHILPKEPTETKNTEEPLKSSRKISNAIRHRHDLLQVLIESDRDTKMDFIESLIKAGNQDELFDLIFDNIQKFNLDDTDQKQIVLLLLNNKYFLNESLLRNLNMSYDCWAEILHAKSCCISQVEVKVIYKKMISIEGQLNVG